MSQPPLVVGLLLCESLIVEEGTHNITLVNCFTVRRVKQFPSEPLRFTVHALLTDGLGEVTLDVVIRHLREFKEIFRRSRTFRFVDPLCEVQMTLRVTRCSFPVAGAYEISLLADGEPIGQKRFQVL